MKITPYQEQDDYKNHIMAVQKYSSGYLLGLTHLLNESTFKTLCGLDWSDKDLIDCGSLECRKCKSIYNSVNTAK